MNGDCLGSPPLHEPWQPSPSPRLPPTTPFHFHTPTPTTTTTTFSRLSAYFLVPFRFVRIPIIIGHFFLSTFTHLLLLLLLLPPPSLSLSSFLILLLLSLPFRPSTRSPPRPPLPNPRTYRLHSPPVISISPESIVPAVVLYLAATNACFSDVNPSDLSKINCHWG
ncbi:hypothetical protein ASPFODRAFT_353957 [Aspergillus luchuensis CBS 106.47]|uniref:Uncharacterized protein n=1 Tax=Aspergillus luchuensis (strain CBS 106.47) TaxID=1137211 RepID=A0A1M3T6I6_ASPLC|nr:hypothetical protein ASPFODRAFT_353957 [Aspergillus luchuensis CBS 106.47]